MTNGTNFHYLPIFGIGDKRSLVYAGRIYMVNLVVSAPIFIKHRNRTI